MAAETYLIRFCTRSSFCLLNSRLTWSMWFVAASRNVVGSRSL